jgi:hypothetical protein
MIRIGALVLVIAFMMLARFGFDTDVVFAGAGPRLREPDPEQAVSGVQSTTPPTVLEDGELMPQGEDLEVQGGAGAEHGDHGNDQGD